MSEERRDKTMTASVRTFKAAVVQAVPVFLDQDGTLCDAPEKDEMLKAGGGFSRIFGPDDTPLAELLPEDEEGIIYADIDPALISIAKSAADPVGHYSRPDVTRLLLNTSPNSVVEYFRLPIQETQPAEEPSGQEELDETSKKETSKA